MISGRRKPAGARSAGYHSALAPETATGLARALSKKGHPIEFVLKGQEFLFYVIDDDGSPLPTKDMQGRATVQTARRRPCRCSLPLPT